MRIGRRLASGARASARAAGSRPASGSSRWALFDWATQPFYTLVVTFLFAPYFVNGFMADPARGAALWAYATGVAELIAAVARARPWRHRRRRPPAQALDRRLLGAARGWALRAVARRSRAQIELMPVVLLAFVLATIGAELATVFTNAMMPSLVSNQRLGTLVGLWLGVRLCRRPRQPCARRRPHRRRSQHRQDPARASRRSCRSTPRRAKATA